MHLAVTCGAAAAEAAQNVSADLFLLAVTGVQPVHGLTTCDPDEAAMNGYWSAAPRARVVLAAGCD